MLVLRLQRTGRKNLATYRIVAADKARPVKGKFQDILGHYLPSQKDPVFSVDTEKVEQWIKKGAIPSDTLARLLKKNGMSGMEKYIASYTKKRAKNAPDEPVEAPAPAAPEAAASEPAPEAPTEEAPADKPAEETPASAEAPADKAVEEKKEEAAPEEVKEEEKKEEPKAEEAPASAEAPADKPAEEPAAPEEGDKA